MYNTPHAQKPMKNNTVVSMRASTNFIKHCEFECFIGQVQKITNILSTRKLGLKLSVNLEGCKFCKQHFYVKPHNAWIEEITFYGYTITFTNENVSYRS